MRVLVASMNPNDYQGFLEIVTCDCCHQPMWWNEGQARICNPCWDGEPHPWHDGDLE
jgi:hypothetical protein